MNRTTLFLLASLLVLSGCHGTLRLFGYGDDDDDDVAGDDDDTVDDDDTGDDDTGDDDTGDDDTGDDDDTAPAGLCEPNWDLGCGDDSNDSYNNGAQGSSDSVLTYSCLNEQWDGPEYTYTYVAERSGAHTVSLYGFDGDLDLFVLSSPNGACSGANCVEFSGNPPDNNEELVFEAAAGETYYVVVDGYAGTVSDYDIRIECPTDGDDDDDDDATSPTACGVNIVVEPHQANNANLWTLAASGFSGPTAMNPPGDGTVWGAVAGDFNGDGAMDFITERQDNSGIFAHLWAGNCQDATFQTTNLTTNNNGFTFSGLDDLHGVGDLDGDGDLDVLGIEFNSGEGRVWLNSGNGTSWTAASSAFDLGSWDPGDLDSEHFSVSMPPADLDRDTVPDLVECTNQFSSPTTCTLHSGLGDGTFLSGAQFTLDRVVNGVAVGDFNGDGVPDLIGGLDDDGDAGQVWIWAGDPTAPSALPSGAGVELFDVNEPDSSAGSNNAPGYGWPFASDVDDDGDLDVVIAYMDPFNTVDHTLALATNDGLGNFTVSTIGPTNATWGGGNAFLQSSIGVQVRP